MNSDDLLADGLRLGPPLLLRDQLNAALLLLPQRDDDLVAQPHELPGLVLLPAALLLLSLLLQEPDVGPFERVLDGLLLALSRQRYALVRPRGRPPGHVLRGYSEIDG